jgi:hypothetical protein
MIRNIKKGREIERIACNDQSNGRLIRNLKLGNVSISEAR